MREFKKATILDVAARAGVSPTTVSLLLKGRTSACSADTARRIRDAVDALGYAPGPVIRGGLGRETKTIGVCVGLPYQSDPLARHAFAERLWRGLLRIADTEGYALLHYPKEVRDAPGAAPFLDGRVDGLVLAPAWRDHRPERLTRAGLPTVLIDNTSDVCPGCGAAYVLEGDVVDLALGHLWALGHRRIAHVAGPTDPILTSDADEPHGGGREGKEDIEGNLLAPPLRYAPSEAAIQRRERYARWMLAKGAFDARLVAESNIDGWGFEGEAARALVTSWRAMADPPTAAFCANDRIALALIAAVNEAGGDVPGGLSVVSVDDTPAASLSDPPLTSVRLPGEEVGVEAMRCLLKRMAGVPAEECRVGVPVTYLATRESTAARR